MVYGGDGVLLAFVRVARMIAERRRGGEGVVGQRDERLLVASESRSEQTGSAPRHRWRQGLRSGNLGHDHRERGVFRVEEEDLARAFARVFSAPAPRRLHAAGQMSTNAVVAFDGVSPPRASCGRT